MCVVASGQFHLVVGGAVVICPFVWPSTIVGVCLSICCLFCLLFVSYFVCWLLCLVCRHCCRVCGGCLQLRPPIVASG